MPPLNIPPILKNLLLINVLMFVITMLFENSFPIYEWLGAFYPASPFFKTWQPATYMFMHGGFAHIFFNMFALYTFGTVLEQVWGGKKFLQFYVYCGLGALLLQWVVQAAQIYIASGALWVPMGTPVSPEIYQTVMPIYNTPMVGASGAIFGVLCAFGLLFPNSELFLLFLPIPIKAKYLIPIYILIELFMGVANFQWDNVAHYAHLGGAIIGFILVKTWEKPRYKRF